MSRSSPEAGLTIGAVAARTGLSVPVLRAWEQRHGFPRPARLHGGHRRYDESEVELLRRVVAAREAGRSVDAAVALVLGTDEERPADQRPAGTIHAGLRGRRPDLPVQVLSRRGMLALSNAIEDECLAHAERTTLTGAFQRRSAYERALPRWQALIASSVSALVFADFPRSRSHRGAHEVSIPSSSPLVREWSVVCDAPSSAAVLAGWERSDGRFEALWSVEPDVVRQASEIGRRLAALHAPRLTLPEVPHDVVDGGDAARRASAITGRVVAFLDEPGP